MEIFLHYSQFFIKGNFVIGRVECSYHTLLPYCHNESKSDIQDYFIKKLKNYNGSQIQI